MSPDEMTFAKAIEASDLVVALARILAEEARNTGDPDVIRRVGTDVAYMHTVAGKIILRALEWPE